MPTAETSTKVNNPTSNGASAIKQALRFSVRSMSNVYEVSDRVERKIRCQSKVMSNLCHVKMITAKEVEGYVSI